MAKETVEAIRQAELNAAQKERDAQLNKEKLISDAGLKAKSTASSMIKDAQDKAEKDLLKNYEPVCVEGRLIWIKKPKKK
jgi:vacuolar-type H+-ATPase subunit H